MNMVKILEQLGILAEEEVMDSRSECTFISAMACLHSEQSLVQAWKMIELLVEGKNQGQHIYQ